MKRLGRTLRLELFHLDRRWLLSLLTMLLFSNLVVNVFVFERWVAPDHKLVPATRTLLYAYNLTSSLVALGIAVLVVRLADFRRPVRLYHAMLAFALVEGFLRATVFTDWIRIGWLENPRLYSSTSCGDDGYFVLRHYYDGVPPDGVSDPLFGWVRGAGELGIVTDRYFRVEDVQKRPILFFGDSFVVWGEPMKEKIPQMMNDLLPDFDVLNYGTPGYGTDQIVLRFQHEFPKFADRKPIVLIGILLDDLDRALLKYRGAQKPYFEISEGELRLHPPEYRTNKEFVDSYHFHSKSFALSMPWVLVGKFLRSEDWCSRERFELNRRILEKMQDFIRGNGVEAYVVLFYSQNELTRTSSRETELKEILGEIGITSVIDTKTLLIPFLEKSGAPQTALYDDGGAGHHTREARRLIATGIVERLKETRGDVR